MADIRTFPLVQYIGVGLAAERPETPERGVGSGDTAHTGSDAARLTYLHIIHGSLRRAVCVLARDYAGND